MGALEKKLRAKRDVGEKILVPFFTGSYPDEETFVSLLMEAETSGADAIEIGIPFSDPSADGPVIQATSQKALDRGVTLDGLLDCVRRARREGLSLPLVLMTYYNPILARVGEQFAADVADAGVDAVLVVDLPPEESMEFVPAAKAAGLDTIFLAAPTTPAERMGLVARNCSGFLYTVSVTGVTGQKKPAAEIVGETVARVRAATDLPVLVGFGVQDPVSARTMAELSDGVIVGSALMQAIGDNVGDAAVEAAGEFLRALRAGLDS